MPFLRVRYFRVIRWYLRDYRVLLGIFFLQFCVILPAIYWDVPWSAYFKLFPKSEDFYDKVEKNLNKQRLTQAKNYFSNLNAENSLKWYLEKVNSDSEQLDLVIAIITTKRTHIGSEYLQQSSAKLDRLVKNYPGPVFAFICNVDKNPENHANAKILKDYIPYVERFGSSLPKISELYLPNSNVSYRNYSKESRLNRYAKEVIDYTFCLNAAKVWNPKNVLVMEDDAVAYDNLLFMINHLLKYRINYQRQGIVRKWAYMKLFYPQKWQGYAFELDRLTELFVSGFIGATVFVFLFYLIRTFYKLYSVNFFFIMGYLFTILSCLVLGRQNVLEFRRLSPFLYSVMPAPVCCTPAMLFPVDVIDDLTSSLVENSDRLKTDLALGHFVRESKLPAFHVEPNLVYHIGRFTSLVKKNSPAKEFLVKLNI